MKHNPIFTDPICDEARGIRLLNQYDQHNKLDEPNQMASLLITKAKKAQLRFNLRTLDHLSRDQAIEQAFRIGFLISLELDPPCRTFK